MKLNSWRDFPKGVKIHLSQRLLDRKITTADLDKLRVWVDSQPDVPGEEWFMDFGSFKIVGKGPNPLSFLDAEQTPYGVEITGEEEEAEIDD